MRRLAMLKSQSYSTAEVKEAASLPERINGIFRSIAQSLTAGVSVTIAAIVQPLSIRISAHWMTREFSPTRRQLKLAIEPCTGLFVPAGKGQTLRVVNRTGFVL
jgi:hypothetical protein